MHLDVVAWLPNNKSPCSKRFKFFFFSSCEALLPLLPAFMFYSFNMVICCNHWQPSPERSWIVQLSASTVQGLIQTWSENTIYTTLIKSWIFTDRTVMLSQLGPNATLAQPCAKNTAMPDVVWIKPNACSNALYNTFSFNTTALLLFVLPALFQTLEKDGFVFRGIYLTDSVSLHAWQNIILSDGVSIA